MEFKMNHHVVLFPFMAQGHITPFLLLAELIHKAHPSYSVTLLSTPLNVRSLRSSLPPGSKISLRPLPFDPTAHGLPPGAESTATVPRHLFLDFFLATEALRPSFERLVAGMIQEDARPCLIIADYFLAWTVGVARKLGALHAVFFTGGAYGTAIFRYLWMNLPRGFNATVSSEGEIPLPDEFGPIRIHRTQLSTPLAASDGGDGFSAFMQRQFRLCSTSDCALVNTVEEFERLGLGMLRTSLDTPVLPVGPLVSGLNMIEPDLLRWLDSRPPASVIYVSFGSQNAIRGPQMTKLATALEASGRPFIWVIPTPLGSDMEAFEERMRMAERGLIVRGWAPQVGILSHPSTGAFLSHCGWNSVLESLVHGVPIVGWPLSAEQFYNSKFLEEEAGVGVEVARGTLESSKVVEGGIERGIEVVMGDKQIRRKANEIRGVLRGALNRGEDGGGGGSGPSGLKELFEVVVPGKRKKKGFNLIGFE